MWKSNNQGDKEETFIQTGRRGRDGQPGGEEGSKAEAGGPGDRPHNPGLQLWEVKPQTSDCKHLWGLRQQWEKLPASQESWLDRPTGSWNIHKHTHPPGKQHQKGPICLWVAGEVTESWQRVEQVPFLPLRPLPHVQRHSAATSVAPPR